MKDKPWLLCSEALRGILEGSRGQSGGSYSETWLLQPAGAPPEPLHSQSKHQSLCSLSLMTTAMGEQLLLPRRLSVASP